MSLVSAGFQVGNLPALVTPQGQVLSAAQVGGRLIDSNGNVLADSNGLVAVANLLAVDAPGVQSAAGSGSGWTVVQTVPSSGSNFTAPRSGNILCLGTLSWVNTAGATNYVAIFFGIWTQAGVLVTRKQVSGAGSLQNNNYFMSPSTIFTGLGAGTALQFRLEFALDAATTACSFGGGATGIPPMCEVIGLGG